MLSSSSKHSSFGTEDIPPKQQDVTRDENHCQQRTQRDENDSQQDASDKNNGQQDATGQEGQPTRCKATRTMPDEMQRDKNDGRQDLRQQEQRRTRRKQNDNNC
jgi:hypothetical protein